MAFTDTLKTILTGSAGDTDLSATNFETPFECENCGSRFETEIRASQPTTCPECGATDVARV